MNQDQKLILISVLIFIIVAGFLYITLRYIYEIGEDENENNLTLLKNEVTRELKDFRMIKRLKHRDLILRKENFTQISDYQKYVTPNNPTVVSYINTNSIITVQQAYSSAVSWIWVSDLTLHGKLEQWLFPANFISDTPLDPDNPIPGSMVSDCESQAYTLVSILEALGTPKSDVRVVVGEVNFQGEIGGHAWVQLYQNGEWFELEATSGPYWDDDDLQLVQNTGFPFSFFKTRPYPVEEYWAFFNDIYYYNLDTGLKSPNLPQNWLKTD